MEMNIIRVVGRVILELLVPFVHRALVEGVFGVTTSASSTITESRVEDEGLEAASAAWREWIGAFAD